MEGIRKCLQILVSSGLVFTVTFFVYGSAKACGVLFNEMEDMNGMGGLTNGLIFSLPVAMNQLAAPAASLFLTKFSRKVVGSIGGVIAGVGFMLMGLIATEAIHYIALALLAGIGFGLSNFIAVLCLHEVAGASFPSLMAIATLGSYTGVTVIPYMLHSFLELHGLNASFIFFGLLCCQIIPFGLFLPNSLPKEQGISLKRTLSKYEIRAEEEVLSNEINEPLLNSTSTNSAIPASSDIPESCWNMFVPETKHLIIYLYILISGLRRLPSGTWTLFLIPYVRENGLSVDQSILAGTLGGVGGVVGRLLAAVSFKLRRPRPIVTLAFYFLISGLVFLGFELHSSINAQLLFSFLSGLLISTSSGMVTGVLGLLVEDEHFKGALTFLEISTGVFSLISGPLAGFGFDVMHTFSVNFRVNALIYVICALSMLLIASLRGKIDN